MNRQQTKDLLPILTAFAEGKEIQFNNGTTANPIWVTLKQYTFAHDACYYRIKPTPITLYTIFYKSPNKGWIMYYSYTNLTEAEERIVFAQRFYPNYEFKIVPVSFEE